MPNNQSDKTKILVVDDDKKILFAFEQVLKRERYACLTASSGPEALAALSAYHPAVDISRYCHAAPRWHANP